MTEQSGEGLGGDRAEAESSTVSGAHTSVPTAAPVAGLRAATGAGAGGHEATATTGPRGMGVPLAQGAGAGVAGAVAAEGTATSAPRGAAGALGAAGAAYAADAADDATLPPQASAASARGAHGAHGAGVDPAAATDVASAGAASGPGWAEGGGGAGGGREARGSGRASGADGAGAMAASGASAAGASGVGLGTTATGRPAGPPRFRVGLYEVYEELGRGGMGAVYKAWHPPRRAFVALKVIKPDIADGEGYERLRTMFLREGGILMGVRHPNVVACYDVNESMQDDKPVLYMALELLEGQSLSQRVTQGGPLPLAEALRVARGIAAALRALHESPQRILHRDLKPANVFLTSAGEVKLLDFGLAGIADWQLTQVSVFAAGSRPYMAPEQFDGLRHCTERSDLYSLGITLAQVATGRLPFQEPTELAYYEAHHRKSPPPLRELHPDVAADPRLEATQNIVTRLLAKKPEERYATAAEVEHALARAEAGEAISRPRVTRPEAARLRRRVAGAVVVAAVLGLAVAAGVYGVRSDVPARLREAEGRRDAFDIAGAQAIVGEVLRVDPNNAAAQTLEADLGRRAALRRELEARSAATEAPPAPDAIVAHVEALEALHADAAASGVYSPAEVAALADEARAAEAARAAAFAAAAGRARAALDADDPAAADPALADATRAAREPSERASLAALARERDERALLRAAAEDLDRGERSAAASRLAAFTARAPLPALADRAATLAAALAEAEGLSADLARAERALARDAASEAEPIAARVRAALAAGGAALEARVGRRAAEAAAVERAARAALALAAVGEAERGEAWTEVRRRVAVARPLVGADAAAEASLARAEQRACEALFDAAIRAAEAAIARAHPDGDAEADARAREALRALPPADAARFRALARAFEDAKAARPTQIAAARDALREALRAEARAERAWLVLERAAARADVRTDERLFERREGIRLGGEDPLLKNPTRTAALAPFCIDTTETSGAAYALYLAAEPEWPAPAGWLGRRPPHGDDRQPARGLAFDDARAFAAFAGKRLPTADEWEAAASLDPSAPGGRRLYPWGAERDTIAALAPQGAEAPREVGATAADRSPLGVLDMGANVQEWTFEPGPGGAQVPVLQGGSFAIGRFELFFRAAARRRPQPERFEDAGVRLARDPAPPDLAEWAAGE